MMLHATPHPFVSSVAVLMFIIASDWNWVKFLVIGHRITSFSHKILKFEMYENAGKYILLFKGYLEDVLLKGTGEPSTHAALVTNGYIRIF